MRSQFFTKMVCFTSLFYQKAGFYLAHKTKFQQKRTGYRLVCQSIEPLILK